MDEYPAPDRRELLRRYEKPLSPHDKTRPLVLFEEETLSRRLRRWLKTIDR